MDWGCPQRELTLFCPSQASGTWSSSSPTCPLSSSCPSPTSSLSRRALRGPRRYVAPQGLSPTLCPSPWLAADPVPSGHHGQGVRDIGGAAAADAAGAGHGLGGLCHRRQQRGQSPVALRWVLPGLGGLCCWGRMGPLVLKGAGGELPWGPAASCPLSPQTSGSTTCPTSTPASRSSACCSCCVSPGPAGPLPGMVGAAQDPSGGPGRGRVPGLTLSSHPQCALHLASPPCSPSRGSCW